MKKFLKALAVLAAVAALGFGFASCSNGNDDGGSGSASSLAAYSRINSDGETETITFYSDNTYAVHIYYEETNFGVAGIMDLDVEKGTYTGDPTKDGSVVCTSVSQVDKEEMQKLMMGAIISGSNSLTITNSNCPLVALDSSKVETRTCTISGTTLTDDDGNKYTRK
ncbi:hypothetical protein [uncultured Treponema sp.]|uniref:hypothetical protein n=1 Tax=uncultured Treponema sp. TaxID=162155 RepID=UPI0026234A06|nr:hypothetical protein [uncultured Treponema sp.]